MITVKRFTAAWCAPCKMIAPIFKDLENELKDNVTFETINVDEFPDLVIKFNVKSVPTVMIFNNENLIDSIVGATNKYKYKEVITMAINTK